MFFMDKGSLLTRDQSNLIKGILIVLIVLGHNSILMNLNEEWAWFKSWLYSFHVRSFLFLPFLYDLGGINFLKIKKNARRLLLPYTIFFLLLYSIQAISTPPVNPFTTVAAYVTGSNYLLRQVTGLTYIWFLPTMFTLLIFKGYSFTFKFIKVGLFIVGSGLLVGLVTFLITPECNIWTPLGMFTALVNFPIAIILRKYLETQRNLKSNFILFLFLSVVVSITWLLGRPEKYIWSLFFYLVLPVTIFPCIFYISKYLRSTHIIVKIFIFFGKISMGIYLLHQIIYNVLIKINLYDVFNSFWYGFVMLILTLSLSVLLVSFAKRYFPKLYKVIF